MCVCVCLLYLTSIVHNMLFLWDIILVLKFEWNGDGAVPCFPTCAGVVSVACRVSGSVRAGRQDQRLLPLVLCSQQHRQH